MLVIRNHVKSGRQTLQGATRCTESKCPFRAGVLLPGNSDLKGGSVNPFRRAAIEHILLAVAIMATLCAISYLCK